MKRVLLGIITICFLVCCTKEERVEAVGEIGVNDTIYADVNLRFNLTEVQTKMRGVNENLLSDFNLYIFNGSGAIVDCIYKKGSAEFSLRVGKNQKYDLYVVANAGKKILVRSVAQLLSLEYTSPATDGISLSDGGIVMVGKSLGLTIEDGVEIPVELKRRVAQIVVMADTSELFKGVDLTFESVSLKCASKKVKLFDTSKVTSTANVFSYSLNAADLFSPEGARGYVYENMQGDLTPSNTEQIGKILTEENACYGMCTYLEFKCGYRSERYTGTIYYRFYLGKDDLKNFDIEGNTRQIIKVYFKGNGSVRENTWRVVTTELTDNAAISFRYGKEYVYVGANLLMEWAIFISDDEMPIVVSSNENVAVVRNISREGVGVRGVSVGKCIITATLGSQSASCELISI